MGGKTPRMVRSRVSDQRAGRASKWESSAIIEAVWADHRCNTNIWRRRNGKWSGKQDVDTEAMVEVSQVSCRLARVVVVRRAVIIGAVMVVHDQPDVFGKMLDEGRSFLLAIYDVREVALRGTDGLPR